MCGLIAWFGRGSVEIPTAALQAALLRMARRGPDDDGLWREPGVALGHRRLAVVDLDHRAAQPMLSPCGRYAIVYNGEIYNFRALRREMEETGTVFLTTSDTEIILALFAAEGESMLPKLHGMFAFVIWDRLKRKAFAARDPYGIKPLYVADTGQGIIFASQVKALLATGFVSREPDLTGQAGFWMLGSVPEPRTWYRDIRTLPAGHLAWVADGGTIGIKCWADVGSAWRQAEVDCPAGKIVSAEVGAALLDSVARHLVSDVPVGVFLSGGIDSSALVGLMQDAGAQDIEGVTIAYDEFANSHENEAPIAAAVAARFGIRHHVRYVTRTEFLADLPRILDAMDQPSIDGVNTWYASKAASERGIKVVISGIGGDELFQGYPSFRSLPRLVRAWGPLAKVPPILAGARCLGNLRAVQTGNSRWRHAADWARSIGGAWWLRRSLFAPDDLPDLMGGERAAEGLWGFNAEQWVTRMCGPLPVDGALALGQIESLTYLRNQLLRDGDWASMDHSLELRTPLVDASLLHQCRGLLPSFKRHPGKSLLANAASTPLPPQVLERKKSGFGIPIARWLRPESRIEASSQNSRDWAVQVAAAYGQ